MFLIPRSLYRHRRQRLEQEHLVALEQAADEEAASTTDALHSLVRESTEAISSLRHVVESARQELSRARSEYVDNAYAPFWDAVERATRDVGEYMEIVSRIQSKAAEYYALLQGRRHNFGPFPLSTDDLPPIAPTLTELAQVFRRGLTNHDFADIWELRSTRHILIEGFRTLGEAVQSIADAVTHGIAQLGSTMEQGLGQLQTSVDATARELKAQSRKLDDIERGR
jgi:hypothetical protein